MTTVRERTWQAVCKLRFVKLSSDGDAVAKSIDLSLPRLSPVIIAWRRLLRDLRPSDGGGGSKDEDELVNVYFCWTRGGDAIPHWYPCGLIADIFKAATGSDEVIPAVYITFGKPITAQQVYDDARAMLWNSLKQAEHIKRHSMRRLQDLTTSQSNALSDALLDLDFVTCYTTGRRVYELGNLRHYPVRFFLVPRGDSVSAPAVVQGLVPPKLEGAATTVISALHYLLPGTGSFKLEFRCHGVALTPTLTLAEVLPETCYADGWLYLVVSPI